MPVTLQGELPLSKEAVERLWQAVVDLRSIQDDLVAVASVSEEEIRALNAKYRDNDKSTNVLTFSYGEGEHDVVISLGVARREAQERKTALEDYVALLLVHAFLHAAGLDHEQSDTTAREMNEAEQQALQKAGFASLSL
ncbi:MAG: rRNA maturation RNase YbeY [Candidatus Andersenbacteria bacterium]